MAKQRTTTVTEREIPDDKQNGKGPMEKTQEMTIDEFFEDPPGDGWYLRCYRERDPGEVPVYVARFPMPADIDKIRDFLKKTTPGGTFDFRRQSPKDADGKRAPVRSMKMAIEAEETPAAPAPKDMPAAFPGMPGAYQPIDQPGFAIMLIIEELKALRSELRFMLAGGANRQPEAESPYLKTFEKFVQLQREDTQDKLALYGKARGDAINTMQEMQKAITEADQEAQGMTVNELLQSLGLNIEGLNEETIGAILKGALGQAAAPEKGPAKIVK